MSRTPLISLDDLPEGAMRMIKAGGKRLAVFRTSEGVFALDNACPHEGYGLVQGDVKAGEVTCAWHNWKFRLDDGACTLGEEAVRAYDVSIVDGQVVADLTDPDPASLRPKLTASLRSAIENDYVGQISRDVVRLLRADADPGQLVWEAIAYGAPRAEFGWGHAIASATDCLALVDAHDGDARALPIVQAIAGISEAERRRPLRPQPDPARSLPTDAAAAFRGALEEERLSEAEAMVLAGIEGGLARDDLLAWFSGAVSDHHLSYGHGAIYVRKAFELLDRIGWDRAATVLPHLVPTLGFGTREDKLPYMRPFMRALADVDLGALTATPADPDWHDDGRLRAALLGRDKAAPLVEAVRAAHEGAGVEGILSAVSLAVSERLLGYDPSVELDLHEDFGWLDITHGLTYADAARWLWRAAPGPDVARLALFTAFQAHYTGRWTWRRGIDAPPPPEVDAPRPAALIAAALGDRAGSSLIVAHHIKTTQAALHEAAITGSPLPLAAAQRLLESPRRERFVASSVTRSIDFLSGRGPADTDDD